MNFENDISNKILVDKETVFEIVESFDIENYSRKELIHKSGRICSKYYFLEKGLIRFNYLMNETEEVAWIVFENTFFTDIFSMCDNIPSFFEIIAIEDTTLYSINKTRILSISDKYPVFKDYLRITWEQNFRDIAEIKLLQQFEDAKMRYEFFLKNEQWMKRVPQKILASYIGITPFSLSRIRRNL